MAIRWYNWLLAFPVILVCGIFVLSMWALQLIRFHSKLEGLPVWLFTASDHVKRIWDLVPDGVEGGDRFIAQSLSVFIITAWLQDCILKHELCHTKQVLTWGILFPFMYGGYWVANFIRNSRIENRVADKETWMQYIRRIALHAYKEIPFEVEAYNAMSSDFFVI